MARRPRPWEGFWSLSRMRFAQQVTQAQGGGRERPPRRRGRAGAGRAWEATGSEGGLLRSGGREELRNAPLLACPVPEHIHVTWNYGGQLSGWGPTRQLPADLPWFPETSRSSASRLPGHSD